MLVNYKDKNKTFEYQAGDKVKVVGTSFIHASEDRWERIFLGEITEVHEVGFSMIVESIHIYRFDGLFRSKPINCFTASELKYFAFDDIEDVLPIDADYPNYGEWEKEFNKYHG